MYYIEKAIERIKKTYVNKDMNNIKKLIKNTRFLLFPNIYTLIVLITKITTNSIKTIF